MDDARPVLALERALDALDAAPSPIARGSAFKRLQRARSALPPGALSEARAATLAKRWPAHLAVSAPTSTPAPEPAVGTAYWLLATDDPHGLVLRLRLERQPQSTPTPWPPSALWPMGEPLDDDARRALEDAWAAADRWLGAHSIDPPAGWHRIVFADGAPAALTVRGRSHTAAVFAMLLSLKLEVPLPADIAVTGALEPDGRITLPPAARAGVEAKHRALARERGAVRTLLVPPGFEALDVEGAPEVEVVETVDALAARLGLPRRAVAPLGLAAWRRAVEQVDAMTTARTASVEVLRARLEALRRADAWSSRAQSWSVRKAAVVLRTRCCEHETHAGRRERARAFSDELDALLADGQIGGAVAARARNVQASLAIDLRAYARAGTLAARALREARAAGDREEEARILGTRARAYAHALDFERALSPFDEALQVQLEVMPWETNIVRTYRADTLAHLGRFDDAEATLDEAERANRSLDVDPGWRTSNALFLDYARLKILVLRGHYEDALALAAGLEERARQEPPWPLAGILARTVDAHSALGDRAQAERAISRLRALDPDLGTHVVPLMTSRAYATLEAARCDAGEPGDLATVRELLLDCLAADPNSAVHAAAAALEPERPFSPSERARQLRALRDVEIY